MQAESTRHSVGNSARRPRFRPIPGGVALYKVICEGRRRPLRSIGVNVYETCMKRPDLIRLTPPEGSQPRIYSLERPPSLCLLALDVLVIHEELLDGPELAPIPTVLSRSRPFSMPQCAPRCAPSACG